MAVKLNALKGAEYFPIKDIIVGKRLREDTPVIKAKVEELAKSLRLMGPIQPLVLDDKNNLIDGGCRYQAYTLLGQESVPVVRRLKVTAQKKLMLEIEANFQRSDLTWKEKVIGIGQIHAMKTEEAEEAGEKWGERATGSMVGQSLANVNNALQVYPWLLKGDEEICKADSLKDAILVLAERKRNAAIAYRLAIAPATPQNPLISPNPSGIVSVKPVVFELGKPGDKPLEIPVIKRPQQPSPNQPLKHVDLSKSLFNADCVSWMLSSPKDSVDVIVTDIPYGVDLANMEDIVNIDMMKSTHQINENLELMPKFLQAAYHILRPNSYLYFFYALQHHEKLRDWGKEAGFNVVDWPLLWLKPHSCKNNAPQCNPTKSFEPCFVMKKGSPVLQTRMIKCHLEVDGMPDKKQQSNPFAKPLVWLSEMIFKPLGLQPGSICLDPFAGEGSIWSAALLHNLQPIGVEIDEDRFPALVNRAQRLYKDVLNTAVDFTLPEMKLKTP